MKMFVDLDGHLGDFLPLEEKKRLAEFIQGKDVYCKGTRLGRIKATWIHKDRVLFEFETELEFK